MNVWVSSTIVGGAFVVWAIFHSVLADNRFKRRFGGRAGDAGAKRYRLIYVAISLATIIPIIALHVSLNDRHLYSIDYPYRIFMWIGQLSGLAIAGRSIYRTQPMRFIGVEGGTGSLRIDDIYRYVRHPMYLGSLLVIWFTPTVTVTRLVLFVLATLYFIVGSVHEEKLMGEDFRESYINYKKSVPRMIPWKLPHAMVQRKRIGR